MEGDICAQCCASSREQTLDCPLDCEHLVESRKHDKEFSPEPGAAVPSPDVELTEAFVNGAAELIAFLMLEVYQGARAVPQIIDADIREAVDALILSYRTSQSGLIYEGKPVNPYAASLQTRIKDALEGLRERLREEHGREMLREADILGSLVFVQRVGYLQDNRKPRGRAFLHHLHLAVGKGELQT